MFVCNSSFSLQTELSAPPPGRGPLPSPLFGGFPSASLLIGQHAASIQLAQLKTQLALTQINCALAVGRRTPAFQANSKTRPRYKHSAAPSPTAVAINLLNVLKIANNMSHPPYNPCGSGNQRSAQRQYDHTNTQPGTARFGSDSSFSSSTIPGTFRSIVPSLTSSNYGLTEKNSVNNDTILISTDLHSTRAREVRTLGTPVQQTNQGANFLIEIGSGEIGPYGANEASFQMSSSSASQGHGSTCVENDSRSLDWLNYQRPPNESASASWHSGEYNVPYIPGLGDDSHMVPEEPAATSSQPSHTAETATSILRQYGLDKEDLEYLISYPEDQMTRANMQKILQQRSLEKNSRAKAAGQTKAYSEPQPTTSERGPHSHTLGFSVETGLSQIGRSAAVLQQSKVIDYGHTRRYKGGALDDDGNTADGTASSTQSRGMLLLDPCHGSGQQPQEKNKRGTNDLSSSSSHISGLNTLKEPEKDGHSPAKPPTSCVLLHGMHPGRPGLVLISSKKSHATENKQDQAAQVVKQVAQQPVQQQSKPQMPREPLLQTVLWPPGCSAESWDPHHSLFNSLPFKGQPKRTMMHDYAAASPRVFPHTCSLCYKECAGMKVSRRLHSIVFCPL